VGKKGGKKQRIWSTTSHPMVFHHPLPSTEPLRSNHGSWPGRASKRWCELPARATESDDSTIPFAKLVSRKKFRSEGSSSRFRFSQLPLPGNSNNGVCEENINSSLRSPSCYRLLTSVVLPFCRIFLHDRVVRHLASDKRQERRSFQSVKLSVRFISLLYQDKGASCLH